MADFVTMLNGFCGIMSIFNSLAFCLSRPSDYTYLWRALGFLPAGLLADFFDGKVARWRGKSSLLGQELDSLADLVSAVLTKIDFVGLIWSCSVSSGLYSWSANTSRHPHPLILPSFGRITTC